jgi:hypothetical protein
LQFTQLLFTLPCGQPLQSTQLRFSLLCGQGLQSAQLPFSFLCGQPLQSTQLRFTLPCGQGLQTAQKSFRLPCEHRFILPISSRSSAPLPHARTASGREERRRSFLSALFSMFSEDSRTTTRRPNAVLFF